MNNIKFEILICNTHGNEIVPQNFTIKNICNIQPDKNSIITNYNEEDRVTKYKIIELIDFLPSYYDKNIRLNIPEIDNLNNYDYQQIRNFVYLLIKKYNKSTPDYIKELNLENISDINEYILKDYLIFIETNIDYSMKISKSSLIGFTTIMNYLDIISPQITAIQKRL